MRYFILNLLLFLSFTCYTQNEFITTWQVSGGDLSIQIPADQFDFTYNYTVDFGDGTVLNNQTETISHTYTSAGTYTVKISGQFPKFDGGALFDNDELISVEQWGNIQWESMESAFEDCFNLTISATDNPDLSNVTNMSFMFASADLVNSPGISTWDVSNVTLMEGIFANADSFNQPLNNWDVSNVTDMDNMFSGNDGFNQALDNWDVSAVTTMFRMFYNATVFNQPLDGWNVSNVTDMGEMFKQSAYNQPLASWDTSIVTNMAQMFRSCPYNHPLNSWNVSNVTDMGSMFEFSPYNHPLDNWNTGSVTDMDSMFNFASFNLDINSWDVSSVIQMQGMFRNSDFNQPLDNWDVSNAQFIAGMFQNTNFNQPLNSWDVSNVTSMSDMFRSSSFNQPLDNWDVSSVDGSGFDGMFANSDFNQDLSSWTFSESDVDDFVRNSEMDSQNYDLLLDRFVQLDLQDGYLDANGMEYCDIFTREKLIEDNNWDIFDDDIGDDCNINYISGEIRFDENGDGCDSNDEPLTQFLVNANDGQDDLSTLPDDNGYYALAVNQGNFSLNMLNLPNFLIASPSVHTMTFTGTNLENTNNDFCITASQTIEDLSIELFPLDDAIPGFESEYELIVENKGTLSVSNVQITVTFDDTKQSFVSATQTPSSTTSNSLTFTISNLPILSSETINFTLLNVQPPDLNSGDIVVITADVTPDANDTSPEDNSVEFGQEAINSFDPNDKLAVQPNQIPDEQINEYIDYKIRFQNVGTANALNVKITDTISDKLDWTTFQPVNSSHDYRLEFVNQEEVNFIFDNINLPYEAIDEEGSNGHVSFRIKPNSNVQIGDVINNKAYIFFDFNAPIITNTYSITIVDELSSEEFEANQIKVYPNPLKGTLNINLPRETKLQHLKLFDANGKEILSSKEAEKVDLAPLSYGLYILKIFTSKGVFQKKVIKE